MTGIGTCERQANHKDAPCGGPLCVSSKMGAAVVACERCGHEHPNHPLLHQKTTPSTGIRGDAIIPPSDFGHSLPERVLLLEREIAALRGEMIELRNRKRAAVG